MNYSRRDEAVMQRVAEFWREQKTLVFDLNFIYHIVSDHY